VTPLRVNGALEGGELPGLKQKKIRGDQIPEEEITEPELAVSSAPWGVNLGKRPEVKRLQNKKRVSTI